MEPKINSNFLIIEYNEGREKAIVKVRSKEPVDAALIDKVKIAFSENYEKGQLLQDIDLSKSEMQVLKFKPTKGNAPSPIGEMNVRIMQAASDRILPKRVQTLQEVDMLPSKEQAQKTFWGLGDQFWMQIIDGKYHYYGPKVFDEGLHNGEVEPGFLESLKNGCEFVSEHLCEKLTVEFYKDLHKKLCAHFKGAENSTEISADKTGYFRDLDVSSRFSIKVISEESWKHYVYVEVYKRIKSEKYESETLTNENIRNICMEYLKEIPLKQIDSKWISNLKLECENEKNIDQKLHNQNAISEKWVSEWGLAWDNKAEMINHYVSELSSSMNVCNLMTMSTGGKELLLNYNGIFSSEFDKLAQAMSGNRSENPEEIEKIVLMLFDRYNQKIDGINLKFENCNPKDKAKLLEEKVAAIADLFQLLEWVHPFLDGQGRTDLVLMAKLLSEEGANPAILNQPYTSSYSLLDNWKEDLLNGIERWKMNANRS
jgi:hypothetical protein